MRHSGHPKSYLATAQAFDREMSDKIKQHQIDRGEDWLTTEEPFAVPKALAEQPENNIILLDCLTLWLTNLILAENDPSEPTKALLHVAQTSKNPIVTVSNEVGHSIIPDSSLGRRFQRAQGRLNAQVAAQADLVVMVTAGLPQVLKGALPKDFE